MKIPMKVLVRPSKDKLLQKKDAKITKYIYNNYKNIEGGCTHCFKNVLST